MRFEKPSDRHIQRQQNTKHYQPAGNVLIYVVVLMLIFGVLGVVMVSLFTSATASTVTRNDSRRARYLSESGVRYAASEMRKADFEEDIIINPLNTLTYTLTGTGSFDLNIFSPWFDSAANVDSPPDISLSIPFGEVPDDFTATALSDVWVVNYEYISGTGPDITTMRDSVNNYSIAAGNLKVDINSDFVANEGERICLAVEPSQAQANLAEGDDLYVARDARLFFPGFNGAVNINRVDYAYERLVDDPDNNRVILKNLTASQFPNTLPAFPLSVEADTGGTYSGDFVVLSPRNYMAIAEGTSDGVSWGNAYTLGSNVFDDSIIRPGSRKPDITAEDLVASLSEQETDTRFFETNLVDYELEIGGGTTEEFGSAFFDANMNIGGERDYCQQGACLLALGVRVFFLLDFDQQGDGITFTLLGKGFGALGPPNNSASSVGGDFELSELMGYAGDSRLVADPDPLNNSLFLASNEDDRGLDPPKIAVEFDTRTNNTAGDPPPDYCSGADANADTRNDPLAGNKDAVQYIFWGRTSFLSIPCRDNNTLYDDNRHDADGEEPIEEWRYGTGGAISLWRPAIGPDGTIYISALDANLYALNEDGSLKWTYNLGVPPGGNNDYMPGVDPDTGTIYSDIAGDKLVAINPDGTFKWDFFMGADVDSTPTVGPDGTIYFGTDITDGGQYFLFALNPDGTEKWRFAAGDEIDNVPALNSDASVVYFVSNDDNLYAVNTADGSERWRFAILAESGEVNSSPIVNSSDGTVYVGSDDQNVYALKPAAREADPAGVGGLNFAAGEWRFNPGTGSDIESSPVLAIDPVDGNLTVYIGSDDDNVYAINADTGAEKWRFDTGANVISSPIVDLDGTIYVGSDNGNIYAINPNGTQKWFFPTGGQVRSSPAIGDDGFIHIGSNDTNFYTISQFADPRNFKDEDKSAGKLLTFEDLDSSVQVDSNTDWLNGAGSKGSWAVRMEVECLLRDVNEVCTSNADGDYEYELRLWIRQCPDQNDFPCSNILGTFYQDTRIEYDYTAVEDLPMRQFIRLDATEQAAFERFFFGFTGAAGAEALDATVSQFQLSFIRPGDPVVDCENDAARWPWEDSAPIYDCTPGF
jgi:outer membrane protein assembly factor BamB